MKPKPHDLLSNLDALADSEGRIVAFEVALKWYGYLEHIMEASSPEEAKSLSNVHSLLGSWIAFMVAPKGWRYNTEKADEIRKADGLEAPHPSVIPFPPKDKDAGP